MRYTIVHIPLSLLFCFITNVATYSSFSYLCICSPKYYFLRKGHTHLLVSFVVLNVCMYVLIPVTLCHVSNPLFATSFRLSKAKSQFCFFKQKSTLCNRGNTLHIHSHFTRHGKILTCELSLSLSWHGRVSQLVLWPHH